MSVDFSLDMTRILSPSDLLETQVLEVENCPKIETFSPQLHVLRGFTFARLNTLSDLLTPYLVCYFRSRIKVAGFLSRKR